MFGLPKVDSLSMVAGFKMIALNNISLWLDLLCSIVNSGRWAEAIARRLRDFDSWLQFTESTKGKNFEPAELETTFFFS